MKVELVDTLKNEVLCTADVTFGLDCVVVKECQGMDPSLLDDFLTKRAKREDSYTVSEEFLKKIGMDSRYKRGCVSRENNACILYSMLCNFTSESDTLKVFPLKDELFTMFMHDPDYTNLYIWEARKNVVNA